MDVMQENQLIAGMDLSRELYPNNASSKRSSSADVK